MMYLPQTFIKKEILLYFSINKICPSLLHLINGLKIITLVIQKKLHLFLKIDLGTNNFKATEI